MLAQPLPHDVKKAIDLLRGDLARPWRIGDLARRCDVPRRTLEKHFRRFVGCAPLEFLRAERLDQARRKLLKAPPGASVMEMAADCGLNHFGRFAVLYRDRYGESPSETLRWRHVTASVRSAPFRLAVSSERPALALLPFDLTGPLPGGVEDLSEAIGDALHRTGWIRLVPAPAGRYHLRGKVTDDGTGTLRIRLMLIDRTISRYVWADCFEGVSGDLFGPRDWFSNLVSGSLRSVLCDAEIDRTAGGDKLQLTAWELSMRALPKVLAADPAATQPQSNCSTGQSSARLAIRFQCRSRRGVMGCAPVTTSPVTPSLSATRRFSWHRRRRGLAPATRYPTQCCRPLTCWPTISPPLRFTLDAHLRSTAGRAGRGAGSPGFIATGAKRPRLSNAAGSRGRSGRPTRLASYGRCSPISVADTSYLNT